MTFLELCNLLSQERVRIFGAEPIPDSMGNTIATILELYSPKHSKVFGDVKAAIRQFSRTRKLTWRTAEEADALRWRFDFALAFLYFIIHAQTEGGQRIIADPDPAIPEEDLIEWALIALFNYEQFASNQWAMAKFRQETKSGDSADQE